MFDEGPMSSAEGLSGQRERQPSSGGLGLASGVVFIDERKS
jgi:hypothetical protein